MRQKTKTTTYIAALIVLDIFGYANISIRPSTHSPNGHLLRSTLKALYERKYPPMQYEHHWKK